VNNIKVDHVSIPALHIEKPIEEDGIKMFGLRDIAAMKLRAIANGRYKAKDYVDICYLLKVNDIPLRQMFEDYKIKYNCTDIMHVKKALTESNKVNPYEWEKIKMMRKNIYLSDINGILKEEILNYNKENNIQQKRKRLCVFRKKRNEG
jgi:hypothetical protein